MQEEIKAKSSLSVQCQTIEGAHVSQSDLSRKRILRSAAFSRPFWSLGTPDQEAVQVGGPEGRRGLSVSLCVRHCPVCGGEVDTESIVGFG